VSVAVVVPAAGSGSRLGGVVKPFLDIAGVPMLLHALRPFLADPRVTCVVVALRPSDAADPPPWLADLDDRVRIVSGGAERQDSVRAGLAAIPADADIVLVHDAARPLVSPALVDRAIEAARRGISAVAGVSATDTIQQVDASGRIVATPDRALLRHAQTPQAFPRGMIVEAYRRAAAEGIAATDDAALVARCGGTVMMIEGERENLKVTTPLDVVVATALLRARAT
jgi:2-C-methyl-D-erythritol 4-phosphate cytidylyltransferase